MKNQDTNEPDIVDIAGDGIDKISNHVKDGNVAQAYAAGVVTGAAIAMAAVKVGSDIIQDHTEDKES